MGLFSDICVGGAWCRRQDCRQRCEGWFSTMPDVLEGCKQLCGTTVSFTKEDFLCSGNYVEESTVIGRYGYDPCPAAGSTLEDFLDPLDDRERQKETRQELIPVLGGVGLLFLAAFVVLVIARA